MCVLSLLDRDTAEAGVSWGGVSAQSWLWVARHARSRLSNLRGSLLRGNSNTAVFSCVLCAARTAAWFLLWVETGKQVWGRKPRMAVFIYEVWGGNACLLDRGYHRSIWRCSEDS